MNGYFRCNTNSIYNPKTNWPYYLVLVGCTHPTVDYTYSSNLDSDNKGVRR